MASRSAVFQCPTHPRPPIAGPRSAVVSRGLPSFWIPAASLTRWKPHRVSVPSTGGNNLMLFSNVRRKMCCSTVASASASASAVETSPAASDREFLDTLERCFVASPDSRQSSSSSGVMLPTMKKEYGAYGAVTLEKSKLDLSQKTTKSGPELATGGGGGDIGKKNFHGGGDGGDDDGDDDDYFDDFDDGEEGDEGGWFRKRVIVEEFFDRKFVDAVFSEWYKTFADLPGGLRQACEMGLVSSAQLVRFLSINAKPTASRLISRSLSPSLSRAFIGRMIADPSFLYKVLLELVATTGSSVLWELKNRKGRIKEEWDLALINVVTAASCNAFIVWSLAPCRSYGSTFRFDLQNTIQKLPNNIFEKSYPMREFDLHKRIHSFFYKGAEICLIGLTTGSIQGSLTTALSSRKEGRLSVTIPSVSNNALGLGAFLGLYSNMRYQLLCGLDKAMFDHFDVLGVGMLFSTVLRIFNVQLGESSRLAWLGIEANPLVYSDNLLKPYSRASESDVIQPSPTWFISKNAIISGLGFLGLCQKPGDSEGAPSKPRRKRVSKKNMSTSST